MRMLRCGLNAAVVLTLATGLAAAGAPAWAASGPGSASAGSVNWLPRTPANWPQVVDESRTPARVITSGVTEYSQTLDTVAGRQHAQIMSVDMANSNVRVGAVEAGNEVIDPADETVTSMGDRTGAVAGINGGYFDINATGQPEGGAVVNGQILKSPPDGFNAELSVLPDGSMTIGQENFSGTITDGAATDPLNSVNIPTDAAAGKITEITPAIAGAAQPLSSAATLVTGTVTGGQGSQTLTVTGVRTGVTSLPVPAAGTADLLGGGAGGGWLSGTVKAGDAVSISSSLSPNPDLTQLISGATVLVKDGQAYDDPAGEPPSGINPETAVGISANGKHAIFVTLDGELGQSVATGVSPAEVTGYMLAHGAYNAILLDGGGSTQIDARIPGTSRLSVLNTPSDGSQRPVANGLFVYTNETSPGAPVMAVVNGGAPVSTVPGATIPVPAYATDSEDNPASGTVLVSVMPPSLGSWSGGQFTAARAGRGVITASDGRATATEPVDVVSGLGSLAVSPADPDLDNGATQQLTLTATGQGGQPVQVPAQAASWSVADSSLGSVSADGLFTAAATGDGLTDVTAKAGGRSASASVAVGSVQSVVDNMSDIGNWKLNTLGGATATMSVASGSVPPGDTASSSMQLSYSFPAASGVHQVVFTPDSGDAITANAAGQDPTGIGLWIKGAGNGPELAESYVDINNTTTTLYPTTITWQGWQLVIAQLPAGLGFPLSVNFLDLLTIANSSVVSGTIDIADLEALYSPRPPATTSYVAIPKNPSWLRFEESETGFGTGGNTILAGSDASLLAADPASPGADVISAIARRLPELAPQARPDVVQALGDISGDGSPADLGYAKSELAGLGVASYHDAVGPTETSSGASPENGNFAAVFGDTHYSYTVGAADVIVTDSSDGGLLASDPYQVPAGSQYPWLAQQLSDSTSPLVVVATSVPADSLDGTKGAAFSDSWEAQMYLGLVSRYQRSHPGVHVVMLYGGARAFADQIGPSGIPQLAFADLGATPVAPASEGGFAHFGLLHVTPGGDFEFSVEPVVSSIAITAPAGSVAAGASENLSATATGVAGGTFPVADPASHVWTSSDPRIATVNPVTGAVTAQHAGTVTITVTAGGVSGSATLTVTG